jgi:predicted kinase
MQDIVYNDTLTNTVRDRLYTDYFKIFHAENLQRQDHMQDLTTCLYSFLRLLTFRSADTRCDDKNI